MTGQLKAINPALKKKLCLPELLVRFYLFLRIIYHIFDIDPPDGIQYVRSINSLVEHVLPKGCDDLISKSSRSG